VLEGRECGGHVGPRSSFVLWEQATALAADAIDRGLAAEELSLVLAGGIHDARSAALVATLAAPLAARGVKVGVLVGTAYIFTREAVETGAIVQRFQDEALRCAETVLLESGPGHQVRVSHTPVVARFQEERRRLLAEGRSAEEVRQALERFNVGRLRVATKALDRPGGAGAPLAAVDDDYQAAHGLYMLGQVATLRNSTTTIAELHRELCDGSTTFLARDIPRLGLPADDSNSRPTEIALIGMAAVFPGAAHVARFWSHTLRGVDAIIEVPPDRWDWRLYYDPDPKAPDKIVSKWGGFLPDVAFDPLRYGMPPSSLPSIEPAQLLALEVVRTALADAGYAHRPFPRERTAVVLGMGGGAAQLAMGYAFRSYLPMLDRVIPGGGRQAIAACRGLLPEWTEDSFPGFLLNVTAGRIANRFNLGGANYTVDAACGSSLAAAALAVRELEAGAADLVILGGVDTVQNPFTYLAFSKTQAFSPRGRCRPFDAGADGIVISEGVAALVLKRKADAERDGDRIYAVIRGVGASSDGRERGLTAPVVDGQVRALERAYARAAVSPATVGYVEAHGTGTALGDVVEVQSLSQVFRTAGAQPRGCVVGSVKSLIGHTKCAAGLAGLINATLALYHKVLPPTIGIESPNPRIDLHDGSFRLCTQAQPWLHPYPERPRRAGVSAFGFGGTNFHAVLEAYEGNLGVQPDSALPEWPIELLIWEADRPAGLIEPIDRLARALEAGARPALCDLAHTLIAARARTAAEGGRPTRMSRKATLVILAGSCHDLGVKLRAARAAIVADRAAWEDPRGVFFAAKPAWTGAPVAFLFPGQGAQSPGMLRELAVAFPEVRGAFEEFERVVLAHGGPALGPLIFPPPAFTETARDEARRALLPTEVAQPAVGAACVGMLRLMRSLGCAPDLVAGHSYGELVALHAAGVLDAEDLAELSLARGRFMQEAGHGIPGAMAALQAGPDVVERLIADVAAVRIANENGPKQTVVAGPSAAVGQVVERAAARGIPARLLPVSSAFHTELVAGARPALERLARERLRRAPDRPVYSNLDAAPHPADPSVLAARLGEHLASPVRFAQMIAALHRDGARVFLEVGPAGVLTPLVEAILADQPHLAVSCDATTTTASGLAAWLRAVARLVTAGLPLRLERLTAGRSHRRLDLDDLPIGDFAEPATPSTWLVNGSRARPLNGPEPGRLGAVTLPSEPSREGRGVPEGEVPHEPKRNQSLPLLGPAIVPGQPAGVPPARDSSPPQDNGTRNPHTTKRTTTNLAPPQADRVLESFQKTMQMFLEVQKATMLAYLHDRGAPAVVRGKETAAEHNAHARHEATPQPAAPEVDTPSISSPADAASAARNGKPWAVVRDPQAVPGPDRAAIIARLREIVRDRTGYPIETLDLDLDIEADLGIDSIKRVEILGKLRDDFPSLKVLSDSADVMDALTQARTLGAIVDRMASLARQTDAELRPATAPTLPDPPVARGGKEAGHPVARGGKVIGIDQGAGAPFSPPENDGSALPFPLAKGGPGGVARDLASLRCEPRPSTNPPPSLSRGEPLIGAGNGHVEPGPRAQRRVLEVVEAPLPAHRLGLLAGGRVVITEDGRGVAELLAGRLEAAGVPAERIGGSEEPVDWTSPSAMDSLVDRLRAQGPLAGIVHALPLGQALAGAPDGAGWAERVGDAVKGLFLLARALAADLGAAAQAGGACLIAATALGGRFASAGQARAEFFPGHGGVAGLVKTLAREWPRVRCRVVDLAPGDPAAALAQRLAGELFVGDGWPEVGYDAGRRIRLRTVESPLRSIRSIEGGRDGRPLDLRPGEPVVVTGGARGITALVAAELARAWQPTLLILGTTPLPLEDESPETASLAGEAEIKAVLHARLRREGRPASPAELESSYQALRRAREVRANLALLRRAGATVDYARADVRDLTTLTGILEDWRRRYGEPVGLIHGAGLIKDKLIHEKTPESFDRVLGTKLEGALNLLRRVRPDALRFTALFSSIAGRFGNVGQSDYAAANEVLNKLAQWLDRHWPGRVVSVIWGPWSGVGMVSQLESHLGRRGLGMIAPEVGPTLLVDELRYGRKGDVEVLYTGGLGTLEQPIRAQLEPAAPQVEALR